MPPLLSPSPFLHGFAEAEEAFEIEPVAGLDPCRTAGAFEAPLAVRAGLGRKSPDILHRYEDLFPDYIGHTCLTSVSMPGFGKHPAFWW